MFSPASHARPRLQFTIVNWQFTIALLGQCRLLGGPPRVSWYNEPGLMNDWRSKTGKHAERVRQEAERAKQASLEAYRKALKSIRTRAPELRAKLPSNREGWVRAGLIALAVLICLVVSGYGVMAG